MYNKASLICCKSPKVFMKEWAYNVVLNLVNIRMIEELGGVCFEKLKILKPFYFQNVKKILLFGVGSVYKEVIKRRESNPNLCIKNAVQGDNGHMYCQDLL